jgi:hypothetical protein
MYIPFVVRESSLARTLEFYTVILELQNTKLKSRTKNR